MSKTVFVDGSPVTPAFLNALNNPVFKASPQNDGELQKTSIVINPYWGPDQGIPANASPAGNPTRWIGDQGNSGQWGNDGDGGFIAPFDGFCRFYFSAQVFYYLSAVVLNSNKESKGVPNFFGSPFDPLNKVSFCSGIFPVVKDEIIRFYLVTHATNAGTLESLSCQMEFSPN